MAMGAYYERLRELRELERRREARPLPPPEELRHTRLLSWLNGNGEPPPELPAQARREPEPPPRPAVPIRAPLRPPPAPAEKRKSAPAAPTAARAAPAAEEAGGADLTAVSEQALPAEALALAEPLPSLAHAGSAPAEPGAPITLGPAPSEAVLLAREALGEPPAPAAQAIPAAEPPPPAAPGPTLPSEPDAAALDSQPPLPPRSSDRTSPMLPLTPPPTPAPVAAHAAALPPAAPARATQDATAAPAGDEEAIDPELANLATGAPAAPRPPVEIPSGPVPDFASRFANAFGPSRGGGTLVLGASALKGAGLGRPTMPGTRPGTPPRAADDPHPAETPVAMPDAEAEAPGGTLLRAGLRLPPVEPVAPGPAVWKRPETPLPPQLSAEPVAIPAAPPAWSPRSTGAPGVPPAAPPPLPARAEAPWPDAAPPAAVASPPGDAWPFQSAAPEGQRSTFGVRLSEEPGAPAAAAPRVPGPDEESPFPAPAPPAAPAWAPAPQPAAGVPWVEGPSIGVAPAVAQAAGPVATVPPPEPAAAPAWNPPPEGPWSAGAAVPGDSLFEVPERAGNRASPGWDVERAKDGLELPPDDGAAPRLAPASDFVPPAAGTPWADGAAPKEWSPAWTGPAPAAESAARIPPPAPAAFAASAMGVPAMPAAAPVAVPSTPAPLPAPVPAPAVAAPAGAGGWAAASSSWGAWTAPAAPASAAVPVPVPEAPASPPAPASAAASAAPAPAAAAKAAPKAPPLPAGPRVIAGEHRVTIHLMDGSVKRGTIKDLDLTAGGFKLVASPGAVPAEIPAAKAKALFFTTPAGQPAPPGPGRRVRVTLTDGRQVEGSLVEELASGLYLLPLESRGGQSRVLVMRHAVHSVE